MTWDEVRKIIERKKDGKGFMVSFEIEKRGILKSDNFPDGYAGEQLIDDEESAWFFANRFAEETRRGR